MEQLVLMKKGFLKPSVQSRKAKSRHVKLRSCFFLVERETLEDHPVFDPAVKVSQRQSDRKKPPVATEGESALNFHLFEKSTAATEEEKGTMQGVCSRCSV